MSDNHESELTNAEPIYLVQNAFIQGKKENKCEDAFFISKRAFGVSDGVGGWSEYGFSSDQFSLNLMLNCKKNIESRIVQFLQTKFTSSVQKLNYAHPSHQESSSKSKSFSKTTVCYSPKSQRENLLKVSELNQSRSRAQFAQNIKRIKSSNNQTNLRLKEAGLTSPIVEERARSRQNTPRFDAKKKTDESVSAKENWKPTTSKGT